jgi:hypothetical protein
MSFNKKLISAAVLSAVSAGAAQAAYLSEDGTGQVLLYPYYTVRGGTDTLITLVNSTSRAKAVKVRFLEGMNSKEVLDFNLYLSKHDVWTAAVTVDSSGNPVLDVFDKTCTAPIRVSGINGEHQEPFRSALLGESGKVNGVTVTAPGTVDRAKEGYIEIIEMGDIRPPTLGTVLTSSTDASKTVGFEAAVTHVNGVPKDCGAVELGWNTTGVFGTTSDFDTYSGGLFGAGTLINVGDGTDYSYDPVALKAFSIYTRPLTHSRPGTESPSLGDSPNTNSAILVETNGPIPGVTPVSDNWTNGSSLTSGAGGASGTSAAAVSAVLMRAAVMNEYVIEPAIHAGTDWVVGFPTRRFHINDQQTARVLSSDFWPFRKAFLEDVAGLCEKIDIAYYDQEERSVTSGIDVSPSSNTFHQLCWEVNVVTFKSSDVLKSTNKYDLTNIAYNAGWATLTFDIAAIDDLGNATSYTGEASPNSEHYMIADSGNTYYGLPTIGFAVEKYVNGVQAGVLSNYGGAFIHKYVNGLRFRGVS